MYELWGNDLKLPIWHFCARLPKNKGHPGETCLPQKHTWNRAGRKGVKGLLAAEMDSPSQAMVLAGSRCHGSWGSICILFSRNLVFKGDALISFPVASRQPCHACEMSLVRALWGLPGEVSCLLPLELLLVLLFLLLSL